MVSVILILFKIVSRVIALNKEQDYDIEQVLKEVSKLQWLSLFFKLL